jgi:signal peptidase II
MKPKLYGLLAALIILALDQITKAAVFSRIETGNIEVLPFFNLVLVWNPGISFGMLTDGIVTGPLPLILFSIAISLFFTVWLWRTDHKWLAIAIGAVIGGALGNVIDRIRFGAVIDFLDFHAFGWHYPAFNVADSAIVLGIAFVVLDGLFWEPKRKGASKP